MRRVLLSSLALLPACIESRAYPCANSNQCVLDGIRGECGPAGFCSYPDSDCPSGQRYESRVPQFGSDCVDAPGTSGQMTGGTTLSGTSVGGTMQSDTVTPVTEGSSVTGEPPPFVCAEPGCEWVTVDAGAYHVCALNARDEVWCWGANTLGHLGIGTSPDFASMPRIVDIPSEGAARLSTNDHSCVINGSSLHCWGPNESNQVDWLDDAVAVFEPRALNAGFAPEIVATGNGRTCVARNGMLACWGAEVAGDPPFDQNTVGGDLVELAAGARHQCGRLSDGRVFCGGDNDVGQLGNETANPKNNNLMEVTFEGALAVSLDAGANHSCVITEDGPGEPREIWCWGANDKLQAGSVTTDAVHTPKRIAGELIAGDWVEVDAASEHTCALAGDGGVWCWGTNRYGRADPRENVAWSGESRRIELQGTELDAIDIATGTAQTCAVDRDSVVWCWGCLTPWALLGQGGALCPVDQGTEAPYLPI